MPAHSVDHPVGVAIIGAGAVSDYHHVPEFASIPTDWSPFAIPAQNCSKNAAKIGAAIFTTDYEQVCADPRVHAVIIATPNFTHKAITLAAAKYGKHVMCGKATRPRRSRSSPNVSRLPRRQRAAHDRLHLSLRPLHALPAASRHEQH